MDEDVASLPMDARVLWAYLPCYADKEGRLEDRPLFLKGQVFPGDSVDVGSMLDMFASRGFVIRYVDHEGRKLIQISHFHRYQRPDHHERESVLPAPANWVPAKRYGEDEENAQAMPRQRPGKPASTPTSAPDCPGKPASTPTSAPDCTGKAAPGLRDSGTPEQERELARDLCGTEHVVPPANEYGKPTPYNVVSMYLAIRAETIGGAKKLFAQPQASDVEKAASWLSSMTPEDCKDLEPAIRLACRHVKDGAQGWTHPDMVKVGFLFGCIVRGWPDLREELHECAPKPRVSDRNGEEKPKPRSTPVKFI
jgi:hypothetical protein